MNATLLGIKQRFGIIGNSKELNQALDVAMQVSSTDLSVLITGESGSGKEVFPQIIHQLSSRKHKDYIAVNCGAIPDGTIDSARRDKSGRRCGCDPVGRRPPQPISPPLSPAALSLRQLRGRDERQAHSGPGHSAPGREGRGPDAGWQIRGPIPVERRPLNGHLHL